MAPQRFIIRGAEVEAEVSGEGPDLIWGHGLSMDRCSDADMGLLDWDRIPFTVVRYDARGHGESESTPDLDAYSWSELAQDQLALADALGISTYVAAGASMGCGTALHVGVLSGGRVKALVLAIPPTAWETRAAQAEQWEMAASVIETEGVEAVIAARAELDPPDPYLGDDRRRELQAAATRAWDPGRLALVMRGATRANLPDRADIARIAVPALILAWTGDPIHPLSTAEELHSLLPDSELHVASTASDLSSWTDLTVRFLKRALDS
jgi:pimeloyl-ACP methyl ester carboxylesterase